jgi:di/tricarboxylate transporter
MSDQIIILGLLILMVGFFIWGRWRYDAISLGVLSIFVLLGYIQPDEAFDGFSHPAVITVALVLLISKGLEKSGFISIIGRKLQAYANSEIQFMISITFFAAILSSFMNNIGAMAMLLPITLGICQKMDWNPSKFLIPLSFASILGGMNTKIGTPPNIIISEFRNDFADEDFAFFDFSFAGVPVSILGVLFIAFIGWRLIKLRPINSENNPLIELEDYLVEMVITQNSKLIEKRALDFRQELDTDTALMGQIDENGKKIEIHGNQKLYEGQILIMKINPDMVADIQQEFGLDIDSENDLTSIEDLGGIEAIIVPKSRLIGRKYQYFKRLIGNELSLLGLWRRGLKFRFRLSNEIFKVGDVLLIANRGEKNNISEKLELAGLMPLWQREFDVARDPTKIFIAFGLFAISLLLVIFNYVPIVVAFLICVIGFVSSKLLTGEGVYRHIDWPVVILLAAMIPIGNTLISYGITDSVSSYLAGLSTAVDYVWLVVLIMIITMFLSDIINNAATAVIMAPLAVSLADKINQPIEPFLMSVAIGASCAFLSPIGHQCNTLVMAPGNYKFGDYWKVGLPLEILIILISVPAIIFYWG